MTAAERSLILLIGGYPRKIDALHPTLVLTQAAIKDPSIDVILVDPLLDPHPKDPDRRWPENPAAAVVIRYRAAVLGDRYRHIKRRAGDVPCWASLLDGYRDVVVYDQLEGKDFKRYTAIADAELPPLWDWVRAHPTTATYWVTLELYRGTHKYGETRRVPHTMLHNLNMYRILMLKTGPLLPIQELLAAHREMTEVPTGAKPAKPTSTPASACSGQQADSCSH
jgi:hypothetical protein